MTVSVVIPLYNKAPYIERAMKSVFAQTHKAFELIVVDDGSTDGGGDIARQLADSRTRVIRQENAGVSAARNRGVQESRTEYVAFLDADDEWLPGFLTTVLRLLAENPQSGMAATAYEILESSGKRRRPDYFAIPAYPWEGVLPSYFRSAWGHPPVCSSAVCVNRKLLQQVGLFPVGESMSEDLDTWARLALVSPVAFSTQVSAIYRRDATKRACDSHHDALSQFYLLSTLEKTMAAMTTKEGRTPQGYSWIELFEYRNKKAIEIAARRLVLGQPCVARVLLARAAGTRQYWWPWLWWSGMALLPAGSLDAARRLKRRFVKRHQGMGTL